MRNNSTLDSPNVLMDEPAALKEKIPTEIPTSGQDWANHIAGYQTSDTQIKVIIEFEGKLDIECMMKAIRMSVDAEPVLGCMFAEDDSNPIWKRLKNIDEIEWCSWEYAINKERALKEFLLGQSRSEVQQIQAKIICLKEHDILCLTLNHSCCDAVGIKDYIGLLSNIYSNLCSQSDYYPSINASLNRSANSVFQHLGITDFSSVWSHSQANSKPTWAFPYTEGGKDKLNVAIRKLDSDKFKKLHSFTQNNGVTLNDILLTAFYRTMFKILNTKLNDPMEVTLTVDLRRYLSTKRAETICNMSGAVYARMERKEEDIRATLQRVSKMMKDFKNNTPGIHNSAAMELMRNLKYKDVSLFLQNATSIAAQSKRMSPLFSNMGVISEHPLKFGEISAKDVYIVSPVAYPPAFIFALGSYNNILTFTVSYYEPIVKKQDVETFLGFFEDDLLSVIV
ncbi:MAG: condensation domain-containing protein [Ruminiclostridium sp.]